MLRHPTSPTGAGSKICLEVMPIDSVTLSDGRGLEERTPTRRSVLGRSLRSAPLEARRTGIYARQWSGIRAGSLTGKWPGRVAAFQLRSLAGLLRCACGDVHVPVYRYRGVDGSARAGGAGRLRAGTGRPPLDHPVGAGRARRPGSGHARGCVLRRVLLAGGVRGGGAGRCSRRCRRMRGRAGSRSGCGWGCIPVQASATATGLVGLDVHRAARVAAAGHGGQVLVSAGVGGAGAGGAAAGRGAGGTWGCTG